VVLDPGRAIVLLDASLVPSQACVDGTRTPGMPVGLRLAQRRGAAVVTGSGTGLQNSTASGWSPRTSPPQL
jgi:hypothetical protein